MRQLSMAMKLEKVKPYPLSDGYYFRNIRPDDEKDIEAWVAICQTGSGLVVENAASAAYTKDIAGVAQICPETDVFFVCDKETDKPVATLTAYINEFGMGRIHMVAALPEVRGKKIGHAMLARGLQKLLAEGAEQVSLTTDDFRRPAIKNYLTAGFQPVLLPEDDPDAADMERRWQVILAELPLYSDKQ